MSKLFKTKFYDRNVVTVAKIVSYDPLKLSLSRFSTKKILADTEECRDFVKLYRFKTGDNFAKRYYNVVNIDFP